MKLTDKELEILRAVRPLIESGEEVFICDAVCCSFVHTDFDSCYTLRSKISDALSGVSMLDELPGFVFCYSTKRIYDLATLARLAWIDKMLETGECV